MWSSEPREGLAACSAKEVPSFLSHFKTLSNGLAPGIEPATSRSAVKRSTNKKLYITPSFSKFMYLPSSGVHLLVSCTAKDKTVLRLG